MLWVWAISFQRGPIRETYDQPVRVAFRPVREVRPAGQIHNTCDFALQSAQFRHSAVNGFLTRFLRPPKQNNMLNHSHFLSRYRTAATASREEIKATISFVVTMALA